MTSQNNEPKKSSRESLFTLLRQVSYSKLFKKYSTGNYSYDKISINNLVFNETCRVVAKFKDFLIFDDNTEFLRRFYPSQDSDQRLKKILTFYETYSKIFPNYLVIEENKYLYRNIRKKQKMIDAINEIKREEKENKKKLNEKRANKKNKEINELFSPKIKEEIKKYQKNLSFKNYKNSFDTDKDNDDTFLMNQNSISISILNWKQYEKASKLNEVNETKDWGTSIDSFITNQSNKSISLMLNALNDNKIYTKDLPNILAKYNKKIIPHLEKKNPSTMGLQNNKNQKVNSAKNKMSKKAVTKTNILNNHIIKRNIEKKNSESKSKKNDDKKHISKYAKTFSNITNSSSLASKRLKSQITSSTVYGNKSNKENNNIDENKTKNKNVITSTSPINSKEKIYHKTTPKIDQFKLKKHFFKTSTNFKTKKASLSKFKEKTKNNLEKKEKDKDSNKKRNIDKKYIKCKHISQDFDSNVISKVTDNLLNNQEREKNFFTDNPNLITGDTKNNENNISEDKVHVNVRDLIKNNKEKDKEKEKIKEIIKQKENNSNNNEKSQTAKKTESQKKENRLLKLPQTKTDSHMHMTTRSLNLQKDKKRNNSLLYKQQTENKMKNNKKLMTNQQKSKTKPIFPNKIKKISNNKINIKKEKEKREEKENNKNIINSEKNEIDKKEVIKEEEIIEKDNNNIIQNKNKEKVIDTKGINNIGNNNKNEDPNIILYNSKSEPNQEVYKFGNKNLLGMVANSSYSKINKIKNNILSDEALHSKFKSKNNFINKKKNDDYNSLNNSAKIIEGIKRKFKSFLVKIKNSSNFRQNNSSHKKSLSIHILKRIQEANKYRTKNNFYRISKTNTLYDDTNNIIITKSKNKTINFVKTPATKNKKMKYFKKNNTNRKNVKEIIKKDEAQKNYMSSFSIKVNRTYFNKDKEEKEDKDKSEIKKKNMNIKKVTGKINNKLKKDCKK